MFFWLAVYQRRAVYSLNGTDNKNQTNNALDEPHGRSNQEDSHF